MFSIVVVVSLLFAVLLVMECAAPGRSPTHPFTVHDLLAMDRISDVEVSPNGKRVVFCVRVTDVEANKGRTDLWIVNADGTGLRRLTTHAAGSSHPRWSPDGEAIYFLSGRSDSSQVWRIAPDGGEAEQVTDLPLDVGSFAVAPDGKHLAVSMEVFPRTSLTQTKKKLDEMKERKASGKVFDRLLIRHWDTWKDGRRSHVFVVPADGAADAEPVDVMKAMDADVPSKPFGGAEEYTFTPDSKSVLFAARNVGRKEAWSTHFDLYLAPVDGRTKPQKVVDGKGATVTNPVFSPDGKTLAYLAMARAGYEADRLRIAVKSWPRGKEKMLTEAWDRSAYAIEWSADGKTIYTIAPHLGQTALFAVNAVSGKVRTVVGEGKVSAVKVAGTRLIYALCHHRSPVEVCSCKRDGSGAAPITQINADKVAAARMGESEQFTFKGWNDDDVYVYVVKPVDLSPKKKYPVAFLIHGGPQGSFGNDFHYRWNPQVYAGAGYAAVMVDFHASTGYGQAFTDAISGHWGDRPVEDLQKGLAATLKRYPWMDPDRIGALGASFGGYMINWIHGNWSEPFKCFICHDGNIDERMAYYDTEELWFPEWERGGTPWGKPGAYDEHNPIDYVKNWNVPTLVIHGGRDYRVVDTQGISTFTALQRKGIPSRLLFFPDENHWVLKPANSVQWHEEVMGWLDRWLKK